MDQAGGRTCSKKILDGKGYHGPPNHGKWSTYGGGFCSFQAQGFKKGEGGNKRAKLQRWLSTWQDVAFCYTYEWINREAEMGGDGQLEGEASFTKNEKEGGKEKRFIKRGSQPALRKQLIRKPF